MIGRGFRREKKAEVTEDSVSRGFDAFELRLGDLMRGERATMGKSLLDVQRELKIKAAYIAAIENSDPTAFDTPGFIAGYVRSYARYLGMDPDWAFDTFCEESGFATAHGMSADASRVRATREERLSNRSHDRDIFSASATPFVPTGEGLMSRVEPGAVGSVLVLVALIAGLGYGAWSVLQEVQRVQFAPVEQTPTVLSDLNVDPLAGGGAVTRAVRAPTEVSGYTPPPAEPVVRLSRPQALDAPVMVARDAPISALDPSMMGAFVADAAPAPELVASPQDAAVPDHVAPSGVQVTADPDPGVTLVAVRPAWVRVQTSDGAVIFETIMNAGDTYSVPQTEDPAKLRIGESGAVYFAINGQHYGPVGPSGQVTSNLALTVDGLTSAYDVADISADSDLAEIVNVAEVLPTD